MLAARLFPTFSAFARFMGERALLYVPVQQVAIGTIANILHRKTRAMYGSQVLPDLAPSTQAQRVSLGFSANQPLLRDGSLLRDSIEMRVGPALAAVGSSEPVAFYHEFGYFNARAGRMVPPRPVFKIALEESAVPVIAVLEDMAGMMLGFSTTTASEPMDLKSRANSYLASISER